jgi:hypothetical protein
MEITKMHLSWEVHDSDWQVVREEIVGDERTFRGRHAVTDRKLASMLEVWNWPEGKVFKGFDFGCGRIDESSPTLRDWSDLWTGFGVTHQFTGFSLEYGHVVVDNQDPCINYTRYREEVGESFNVTRMLNVVKWIDEERYARWRQWVANKTIDGGLMVITQEMKRVFESPGLGKVQKTIAPMTKIMFKDGDELLPIDFAPAYAYPLGSIVDDHATTPLTYSLFLNNLELLNDIPYRAIQVEKASQVGRELNLGWLHDDASAWEQMEENRKRWKKVVGSW